MLPFSVFKMTLASFRPPAGHANGLPATEGDPRVAVASVELNLTEELTLTSG